MHTRESRRKKDDVQNALDVVEWAIGQPLIGESKKEKNPHAQALSRLGASKGGKARAAKLTAKKRQEIAKRAAKARWKKT